MTIYQGCFGVLKCASKDEQLKKHDCLVVCLMGHGDSKADIYDGNKKSMQIADIMEYFSSENCPMLKGKPKIIIVQSCRGGKCVITNVNVKLLFFPNWRI